MRHGLGASDDMELGRVGEEHPATRAKLRELELRALERSGRLEQLRKEAGLPEASQGTKQKIISRLGKKSRGKTAAPIAARGREGTQGKSASPRNAGAFAHKSASVTAKTPSRSKSKKR